MAERGNGRVHTPAVDGDANSGVLPAARQLEVRERQQAAVAHLGLAALGTERLQSLLDEAVALVTENLGTEFAKLLQLLPGENTLLLRAGVGWRDGLVGHVLVPGGRGSHAGLTLQSNAPVIVSDLANDRRFLKPALLSEHGVVSGLSVIVGRTERPWGVLGAHTTAQRDFSADDINFLQAVANVVAAAIQRHEIDRQLRERLREVSLLEEAARTVAESNDPTQALQRCLDLICEFTNWPIGQVYLASVYDRDEMELSTVRHSDDALAAVSTATAEKGVLLRRGEGLAGEAWATGEAAWTADLERCSDGLPAAGLAVGVRSAFALPIKVGSDVVAVFEFFVRDSERPSENLLKLVGTVGEQASRLLERSRAEEGLAASADRLKLALTAGQMGAWEWDLENDLTHWNDGHYEMLGYRVGEVAPSYAAWRDRVHPEDRPRVEQGLETARKTGADYREEYRVVWRDGTIRWLEARARYGYDRAGRPRYLHGVLIDQTERRQYEDRLREKTLALEDADRRKNEFLAVLGHELRNPLAGLQNAAALLEYVPSESSLLDKTRSVILNQVGQLTRLLDDLLDFSRISHGRIVLKRQRVALEDVVASAIESTLPSLQSKSQTLDTHIANAAVYVDPTRAAQILANLLGNASRYSDAETPITLRAGVADGKLRLSVADRGRGFSAEQRENLFLPFKREAGEEADPGGLGLGLAIVKELAELHGGTVSAFSPGPDQGSEFVVELPASGAPESEAPAAPSTAPPPAVGLKLFLVDDNVDGAEALAALLEMRGCAVHTFGSGEAALAAFAQTRPDAMIVDLGLPGISGYELAKRARRQDPAIVLVALTGFGHEEARRASAAAGFDRHLAKPIGIDELLRSLSELIPS